MGESDKQRGVTEPHSLPEDRLVADVVDYDADARRLTYRFAQDQNEYILQGKNIIAAIQLPSSSDGSQSYAVAYVQPQNDAAQSAAQSGGAEVPGDQQAPADEEPASDMKRKVAKIPAVKSVKLSTAPPQFVSDYGAVPSTIFSPSITLRVVVSIKSGTCQADLFYKQALRPALEFLGGKENENYSLHYTTSARSITEISQTVILDDAAQGKAQRIILLSGDGGIHDIVNALALEATQKIRSPTYVAPQVSVLPLGTGNALANSIGMMEGDETWGLSHMCRGTQRKLPLMCVDFSPDAVIVKPDGTEELTRVHDVPRMYGAIVCSWAIHAAIVGDSDTEEYRKLGAERFSKAAHENLYPSDGSPTHIYKAKVSLIKKDAGGSEQHEELPREEHSYVLATLVRELERGFPISPATRPLDGKLRIVHWGPKSGDESLQIMMKAFTGGKHVQEPGVGYECVDGLQIELGKRESSPKHRRICVDGKIVLLGEDGFVKCSTSTLRVIDMVCMTEEAPRT